jgi:(1->4)-alpha-D-glucan 1-alpha-D-glucosylmutase
VSEVRATYRLQLGPGLGFDQARELVPYLAELGVSHLYLSPSFEARAGSTHGYDVIDPRRLSEALGGEAGFRALAAAARAAGLGIVLDVVPNHMAADDANPFWADEERRATFFDIDRETGFARRFFDIDHLIGVRVEDPEVFETTHALALSLVAEGLVDGLRIDHPDGLADPRTYLERLRARGVTQVWVEKIVDPGERLRASWPVSGTTGYEFLNDVIGVFVDPSARDALTRSYCALAGDARGFGEIAQEAKAEQARGTFAREVDWLERLWPQAPGSIAEALCSLPVYRTYIDAEGVPAEDAAVLLEAAIEWVAEGPADFVTRFQQTTPPVTAKGVEDTAFYRYGRLLALNDVGGDPSRFGIPVAQLHEANTERARSWPHAMLTLQTHDTKRSADVRARLAALTWLVDEWVALAEAIVPSAPDPGEGWFFLQTVVAAPVAQERLRGYVEKALRERKWTSTWAAPDVAHERRVADWVAGLLRRDDVAAFADRLASVAEPIVLGQKLLALTAPGVPDVYQGDEDEFVALVDPDNRRPVDWAALRTDSPSPKLALTRAALGLRLAPGMSYLSYDAGPGVMAYWRDEGRVFVAVAVRPGAELPGPPEGSWRELFSAPGVVLRARL